MSKAKSLRERLQSAPALKVEPFDFPGFERVWIREFNGEDRDRAARLVQSDESTFQNEGWRGRTAALYLCEEDGTRTLDPVEDGPWLNTLSAAFLEAVINKGGEMAATNAGAVAEAKANFPDTPSSDSGSGSPSASAG